MFTYGGELNVSLLHQRVRQALGDQLKSQGYTLSEDPELAEYVRQLKRRDFAQ